MAPFQPPLRVASDSSSSSQHATHAPSLSISTNNPNIFSDDNALESIISTPDSNLSPTEGNRGSQTTFEPSSPPIPNHRQSSVSQELVHNRGSAVENEMSSGLRREGSSARNSHRRISRGSCSEASKGSIGNTGAYAMPRTQSPYQGTTRPSHPYGMYPQDIGISRSPSAATASGVRAPDRTHLGAGGPTQPYGMYPQSTVAEDDTVPGAEIAPPMLGFPGRARNYQRRFGPDSDEAADIVGPDGYTEQLPAYTRYANDIPPKASHLPLGTPPEGLNDPTGISRDTFDTAPSEDSVPRSPALEDSSAQLRVPEAEAIAPSPGGTLAGSGSTQSSSEGGHFKERVKERGKKRICWGKLPMWVCMVFLAVGACIVGGMIGGILGRAKAAAENARPRGSVGVLR